MKSFKVISGQDRVCSGIGLISDFYLRSRNSQPCPIRFRISELGNKVPIFDTFDRGFVTADKLLELGQMLNVVYGGKEFSNVHSIQDFPKARDHNSPNQYGPPV